MTPAPGPQRRRLESNRWHFQHGPIDLLVCADGDVIAIDDAIDACWMRFQHVLTTLVDESAGLRCQFQYAAPARFAGPVAARMAEAVAPLSARFITPMAAVAGAVADELIGGFERAGIRRAAINNGGDIALYLTSGERFDIAVLQLQGNAEMAPLLATINADSGVRGVATSGWRGRSFSLGIADSVTVLAHSAAGADAAATMIANAVNLPDTPIKRRPAAELKDDSDLGQRLVTVGVPDLSQAEKRAALRHGTRYANVLVERGLIHAAAMVLQGETAMVGPMAALLTRSSLRNAA